MHTNNIQDWNISRQLWGQQIPFFMVTEEDFVVAETIEEALKLAQAKTLTSHLSLLTSRC
jgi:valyl-tRNA synthetase